MAFFYFFGLVLLHAPSQASSERGPKGGRVKAPTATAGHLNLRSEGPFPQFQRSSRCDHMAKHGKKGKRFAGLHMKTRGVGMSTDPSRYSKVEAGRCGDKVKI
ncbi:hypothetical protein TWF730_007957 [Orbilia blumenaviensis]|uniref:Secreted protein n=1 Tax=Orbilia blumenaviensis TaxID=1796055 RepID=A0AAV9VC37_9PEZI